jgi:dTDP-glucose 4,6-dehydratase
MNILITGGMGFMGSNMVRYQLEMYPNDRIVNLDKLTYAGNPENLKEW